MTTQPPLLHRTSLWKVAALAFAAMCADDLAATVMVVFESRYNAAGAAAFDVIGWFFSLVCSALAIESIIKDGWRTKRSLILILSISLANAVGTFGGVYMARALS